MREEVVGLTLLAVGSSLPELGAGIAAAVRKQSRCRHGQHPRRQHLQHSGRGRRGRDARAAPALRPEFTGYSNWAMGLAALMITIWWCSCGAASASLTGLVLPGALWRLRCGLVYNWSFDDLRSLGRAERPGAGALHGAGEIR